MRLSGMPLSLKNDFVILICPYDADEEIAQSENTESDSRTAPTFI
jgi:hypothetical protein